MSKSIYSGQVPARPVVYFRDDGDSPAPVGGQQRAHAQDRLPGPEGSEQYCYSLEPPTGVAVRAGQIADPRRPIVVSADVGPDLIEPWRKPSLVILYTKHVIDPADLKLVSALGAHDANVIVRLPDDRSVFPFAALTAQVRGNEVPLADPLQQIWDLQDLGGADRLEAAGRLRQWLLARH